MRRILTWAAPLTVVAVAGGAAAVASDSARPELAPRSAEEVLTSALESDVEALSGTFTTRGDMGLPDLPGGTTPVLDVLSGETEVSVWIDGPAERQRVDVTTPGAELRLRHVGDEVTFWDGATGTLRTWTVPDEAGGPADGPGGQATSDVPTPDRIAADVLDELSATTDVSVGDATVVAGRDAYLLLGEPKDDSTLVDRVEVAVDAETGFPLRLTVFAVGQRQPAFTTSWRELSLAAPDASVFEGAVPAGATPTDEESLDLRSGERPDVASLLGMPGLPGLGGEGQPRRGEPTVVGEGWSAVTVLSAPPQAAPEDETGSAEPGQDPAAPDAGALGAGILTPVAGGQAFTSALFSVLLADDGRVLVGAVPVPVLEDAAAR